VGEAVSEQFKGDAKKGCSAIPASTFPICSSSLLLRLAWPLILGLGHLVSAGQPLHEYAANSAKLDIKLGVAIPNM